MADATQLQQVLANLQQAGTRLEDSATRQLWQFAVGGHTYHLRFYPRRPIWRRLASLRRSSPAASLFACLQTLQRAKVPAPRAVAILLGYRLDGRYGDALLTGPIPPSTALGQVARQPDQLPPARRRQLRQQLLDILRSLGTIGIGHSSLGTDSFHIVENGLWLMDIDGLRRGGLKANHVFDLAHRFRPWASDTDLLRGWRHLQGDAPPPADNPRSPRLWAQEVRQSWGQNSCFGHLDAGPWRGQFFKHISHPPAWSALAGTNFSAADWAQAWPKLLTQLQEQGMAVIKDDASGQVLGAQLQFGQRTVDVVIKRPRRRYWYRYINEIGRGSRAARAWHKAWQLVVRDLPTAWPLLMMQKRKLGYVTDQLIVFERLTGRNLLEMDLQALPPDHRTQLMYGVGRLLRQVEQSDLYLYDAKATNWMVVDSPRGPRPMLVDVDGLRSFPVRGGGWNRLLRSLRTHRQFATEDEAALRRGYRPFDPAS